MTNVDELLNQLIDLGQHPKENQTLLQFLKKIGHFTDEENTRLYTKFKPENKSNQEISRLIEENIDIAKILINSSKSGTEAMFYQDSWGMVMLLCSGTHTESDQRITIKMRK